MRCRSLADHVTTQPQRIPRRRGLGYNRRMPHIAAHDGSRPQHLLESLDDYLSAEDRVRFIGALVDELSLAAAGVAQIEPTEPSRLGYPPTDLRKLYRHGCLNLIRLGRRLEVETRSTIDRAEPRAADTRLDRYPGSDQLVAYTDNLHQPDACDSFTRLSSRNSLIYVSLA